MCESRCEVLPFKAGRTCQRQPTVQRQRWLHQTSHSETDSWCSHCYQNAQQRWQCATASPRSAKWSCSCFYPSFCKHSEKQSEHLLPNDEVTNDTDQPEICQSTSLADQIASIAATELESKPTSEVEEASRNGYSASLSSLPDGLFRKVLSCGDRLVTLAPQLISNLTSNLAECYMGLRTTCDGGKQYNRVQGGSFEHRCYTAGLQAQHGPQWGVKFWEETTGQPACQVNIHVTYNDL